MHHSAWQQSLEVTELLLYFTWVNLNCKVHMKNYLYVFIFRTHALASFCSHMSPELWGLLFSAGYPSLSLKTKGVRAFADVALHLETLCPLIHDLQAQSTTKVQKELIFLNWHSGSILLNALLFLTSWCPFTPGLSLFFCFFGGAQVFRNRQLQNNNNITNSAHTYIMPFSQCQGLCQPNICILQKRSRRSN